MKRTAFTMVELMVAIALCIVLMLGVSKVFSTISSTVSATNSISENTRVARAAQSVFAKDFGTAVTGKDAPFLTIYSMTMPAYRNRADELSDQKTTQFKNRDQLTIDIDGNNNEGEDTVPGERVSSAAVNHRNHRTDILTFFVRDLIRRQTGNPGQNMISPMTSTEAWVRYSHAQVWNGTGPLPNAGSFIPPGGDNTFNAQNNPNNWYASQWVLSRSAVLLTDASTGTITDSTGTPQRFWQRATTPGLTPLSDVSRLDNGTSLIQEAVVDLAGITMGGMRQAVLDNLLTLNAAQLDNFGSDLRWRPCVNPLMPKPINAQTLAQTVPVLVPGCTQFIVEYAGDFCEQARDPLLPTYGNVTGICAPTDPIAVPPKTDGEIDFIVVGTAPNQHRVTRWYGLPREVTGDRDIPGWQAGRTNNQLTDVVPLRDVMRTMTGQQANTGAPFEKGQVPTPFITPKPNYLDTTGAGNSGMGLSDEYICVWTPNDTFRPKMIRITLVIDDPAGRNPNPDGQIFEYVFELP